MGSNLMSRRRLLRDGLSAALAVMALVASIGVGAASHASPPTGVRDGPPASQGAQAFAREVLGIAPVPAGATVWRGAPPTALASVLSVGVEPLTDLHELYAVTVPPSAAGIVARLPSGAAVTTSWNGSGPEGGSTGFVVSVPTAGPNQYLAQLVYSTLSGGAADVLRIDAEVVWVADRPSSETIPSSVRAVLTGFRTISAASGAAGPLSVNLDPTQSARLSAIVDALPLGATAICAEDAELYAIHFQAGSGATYTVTGSVCGRAVRLSIDGHAQPLLSDRACSLLDAVRSLLPPSAAGSRGPFCPGG